MDSLGATNDERGNGGGRFGRANEDEG